MDSRAFERCRVCSQKHKALHIWRADACRFVALASHIRFRETTLPGRQVGVGVDPSLNASSTIPAVHQYYKTEPGQVFLAQTITACSVLVIFDKMGKTMSRNRRSQTVSPRDGKRISQLIWDRLYAPFESPSRESWQKSKIWSFLGSRRGEQFSFCPFDYHWEFDGTIDDLRLNWSKRRRGEIEEGAELTKKEMVQWQKARAEATGIGEACVAHIEPTALVLGSDVEPGYCVFVAYMGGAAEDLPGLEGIYSTIDEATDALKKRGSLVSISRPKLFD